MRNLLLTIASLSLLFVTVTTNGSPVTYTYSGITDGHLHYVDFLQSSEGINTLLQAMNNNGVQNVMITGLPLIKKWDAQDEIRPSYYLDNDSRLYYYSLTDDIVARAVLSLPINDQKRFHPFICGFNPTDKNAINHIKLMMAWYPNFWQGIGEIITRHGALTQLTQGEIATANNPALNPVYDYAAQNHLPVLIHSDISTIWVPEDSSNAQQPIYLNEIIDAVKSHPKTTFIWAHAGLDRNINIKNITEIIDHELSTYNNLYIDISGFTLPYIVQNGKVDPKWVALIKKYPNRVILGTDTVGHFVKYNQKIDPYKQLLEALPPAVASKVSTTNFLALLPNYTKN